MALRIRRVDVYRFSMTLTLKFAFRKYFLKWTENIFRHSGHLRVENNNINFERAPSKYPKIRLVATVENLYSTQYTIKWFVPKIVAGFPSEQKFRVFFYLFIYLIISRYVKTFYKSIFFYKMYSTHKTKSNFPYRRK